MEALKYALFITAVIVAGLAIAFAVIGIARWTRDRPVLRWSIVTVVLAVVGIWIAVAWGETEFDSVLAIPCATLIVVVVWVMIRRGLEAAKGRAVAGVNRGMERAFGRRRVCQVAAVICWMCTGVLVVTGGSGLLNDPGNYWFVLGFIALGSIGLTVEGFGRRKEAAVEGGEGDEQP